MSTEKNTIHLKEKKVLFYIPVTSELIQQIVIALSLICRASERSIVSFFKEIFDYSISLGGVHSILEKAVEKAQIINQAEILSNIRVGAHDEIFQGDKPILVGSCVESTYTYLLNQTDSRDACTWGIHLLDLEKKGLYPDYTIADGAHGIRSGQSQVWPTIPCLADVFHVLRDGYTVATYLQNKALKTINEFYKLEKKSARTQSFFEELEDSEAKAKKRIRVADNFEILLQWLREDVLSSVGAPFEQRKALFLWILTQLEALEPFECGNHIKKIRIKLYNQLEELLVFVEKADKMLEMTASFFNTDLLTVRRLYEMQKLSDEDPLKTIEELSLRKELRSLYYPLEQEVKFIIKNTFRASSIVENINSKLRNYFFLRKSFQQGSLDLLRFFFNHKVFTRSAHPKRVGKSPAELLHEKPHPHWLEMLGFTRFKQAVA